VVKFRASSKPAQEVSQTGTSSLEKDDDGERGSETKGSSGSNELRESRDSDSSEVKIGLGPQSVGGRMLGKHPGSAITMKLKTQVK